MPSLTADHVFLRQSKKRGRYVGDTIDALNRLSNARDLETKDILVRISRSLDALGTPLSPGKLEQHLEGPEHFKYRLLRLSAEVLLPVGYLLMPCGSLPHTNHALLGRVIRTNKYHLVKGVSVQELEIRSTKNTTSLLGACFCGRLFVDRTAIEDQAQRHWMTLQDQSEPLLTINPYRTALRKLLRSERINLQEFTQEIALPLARSHERAHARDFDAANNRFGVKNSDAYWEVVAETICSRRHPYTQLAFAKSTGELQRTIMCRELLEAHADVSGMLDLVNFHTEQKQFTNATLSYLYFRTLTYSRHKRAAPHANYSLSVMGHRVDLLESEMSKIKSLDAKCEYHLRALIMSLFDVHDRFFKPYSRSINFV